MLVSICVLSCIYVHVCVFAILETFWYHSYQIIPCGIMLTAEGVEYIQSSVKHTMLSFSPLVLLPSL